jgi:hypothetical protein
MNLQHSKYWSLTSLMFAGKARSLLLEWSPLMHSSPFILFVTYAQAYQARVLQYNRLDWLARDKHPSLLGPFECYKEN